MARSSGPDSVGSQFFIVLDDEARTALADPKSTITRSSVRVTSGMEAVDAIAAAADGGEPERTRSGDQSHRREPLKPHRKEPTPMTRATIATDIGTIEVELFDQSAPKATANFVKLANDGFYDDVIFHRVIPGSSSRPVTASTARRRR